MSTRRLINKYPNRRLYDTEESRYITLTDIRDLVLAGIKFEVIDKKDGRDITRCILLQVICEREQDDPVLSQRFLLDIIRSSEGGQAAPLSAYLERTLAAFRQEPAFTGNQSLAVPDTARTVSHWTPQLAAERKTAS